MTTLVLAPGLLCDEAAWSAQIKALGGDVLLQVAHYGELNSLTKMAESVLAHAPPRFALAGHSMGGRVALEVMRLAPERVSHLGLFDTGQQPLPTGEAGEKERASRMILLDTAKRAGMRAMAREWVQNMIHPSRLRDTVLIDAVIDMFARKTPEIYIAQIEALLNRPDATEVLGRIRCPTLLLHGAQDTPTNVTQHLEMARGIAGCTVVAVPNCGHLSMMERPDAVNEAMRNWLGL